MSELRDAGEALWRRAVAALRARDQWPASGDRATPAEVAAQLSDRLGDPRLLAFVEGFYYPQRYGEQRGALSLADAMRLVEDLERTAAAPVVPEAAPPRPGGDAPVATPVSCGLCGRDVRRAGRVR